MSGLLFLIQSLMLAYIIGISVFFVRRRGRNRCIRAFSVMCMGACLWGGGQLCLTLIALRFPSEAAYFWLNTVTYAGICIITPASTVFSWVYRGRHELYTDMRLIAALYAPAALLFALNLTNPLHGMYYSVLSVTGRVYAPVAYICAFWSYASVSYACATLAIYHMKRHPHYIKFFLLCGVLPLAANTLNMLMRDDRYDLTVTGLFSLMAGAGVLIFRHKAVYVSPLASKKILEEIGYPVYVLSADGEVLFESNAAAAADGLKQLYESRQTETVSYGEGKVYKPRLTPLPDGNALLAFTDITPYVEMLTELTEKSAELKKLQAELAMQMSATQRYSLYAEADAAQRSRAEIMRKLNDRIYVLINRIQENTERALRRDRPESEAIKENISLTAEGIGMVRAIINEYKEMRRYEL